MERKRMNIILDDESEEIIKSLPKMFRCGYIREAIIYYALWLGRDIKTESVLRMVKNNAYLKKKHKELGL